MIENEEQLRYSIESVAKMYRLIEREANEQLWDTDTRADNAESTESMIRKIEREIAEYLAKKYGLMKEQME